MSTRARNLYLTLACFILVAFALRLDGLSDATRTALITAAFAFVTGLWMRSSRGPAVVVPLVCLASLALAACEYQGGSLRLGAPAPIIVQGSGIEGLRAEYRAQAGLIADVVEWKPAAAPTCTVGRACMYASNVDGLLYTKDANELTIKLHAAQSFRTAADCTALAAPANGDVCYSTGLGVPQFYAGGWTVTPVDSLVVHLAGVETITGAKSFTGDVTLGDAIADTIGIKGAPRLYNNAGTFYVTLTNTATANRAVTLPDAAGQVILDSSSRTAPAPSGAGKLIYDTGSAYAATAAGTTVQVLHGAAGAPTWSAVSLTADVTGTLPVANGGTGATTTSQYFVFAGPSSGAGAPGFRALVAGDFPANSEVFGRTTGGSVAAIVAATAYLTAPGLNGSATEVYLTVVTRASTARNLYCFVGTAPGGADTLVVTVRKNAADQALTCTITGAATTCNDTTHTFASVAADRLSIKGVSSGALVAGISCSFEETN